jgi:hypothetical protein
VTWQLPRLEAAHQAPRYKLHSGSKEHDNTLDEVFKVTFDAAGVRAGLLQ